MARSCWPQPALLALQQPAQVTSSPESSLPSWHAVFPRCTQPALFVSAEKDGLAPPDVVLEGFREWGGPKRLWSCGANFGHTDVLLGRSAPETVFPVIRKFLEEQSEAAVLAVP